MRGARAARTVVAMEGALRRLHASGAADRRSSLATGSGAVLGLAGLAFLRVADLSIAVGGALTLLA